MAGNLSQTLEDVTTLICRYVVISPPFAYVVALWIAHTWCFASFEFTPYLMITSPGKRSGKSRLLELLERLVREPSPVVEPTAAALFREISALKPTLLIDEVDVLRVTGPIRAVLNRGFQRGGYVTRVVGDRIVRYECFAPKAFAGITGRKLPLPDTTADRCIRIELRRKLPHEKVQAFRGVVVEAEAIEIRRRLRAELAEHEVALVVDEAPPLPDELHDRARDGWEPLFRIARAAGGEWPERIRAASLVMTGADDEPDEGTALLADCYEVFERRGVTRLRSAHLVAGIAGVEERQYEGVVDATRIARVLRPFGITPKMIRFTSGGAEAVARGYERTEFEDSWRRYLA